MCEADYKVIARAIRDQVTAIKRERDKQRRPQEEALNTQKDIEEEPDLATQQLKPSNQKAAVTTDVSTAGKVTSQVCLEQLSGKQQLLMSKFI